MKTILLTAAMMILGAQAQADGWQCETETGLVVKVYNNTDADLGTRNAAVMILSDAFVGSGNKTIARFTEVNGRLTSKSSTFVADVDLRYADSRRAGEYIMGTRLGEVDQIVLKVNHMYSEPISAGEETDGLVTVFKRNGDALQEEAVCVRYLKH